MSVKFRRELVRYQEYETESRNSVSAKSDLHAYCIKGTSELRETQNMESLNAHWTNFTKGMLAKINAYEQTIHSAGAGLQTELVKLERFKAQPNPAPTPEGKVAEFRVARAKYAQLAEHMTDFVHAVQRTPFRWMV